MAGDAKTVEAGRAPAKPPPRPARPDFGAGLGKRVDAYFEPVSRLGLEAYALELDTYGYTVIPPQLVGPPELAGRIREAILRVAEKRTGVKHALDQSGDNGRYESYARLPSQYLLYYLLFEDPVFEEWLENPVLHAMAGYTMRGAAQLSSLTSFIKWKGDGYGETLGLHSDSPSSPDGVLPTTHDFVCNCAMPLTEYTEENGAIAMVPGSHRLFRQPRPGEGVEDAVPVEAPVGSLIFWRGATWHGAYPKRTEGLRITLTTFICNRHFKTQERYQRAVPREMYDRHSTAFAKLLGGDDIMGWGEFGAEPTYLQQRT